MDADNKYETPWPSQRHWTLFLIVIVAICPAEECVIFSLYLLLFLPSPLFLSSLSPPLPSFFPPLPFPSLVCDAGVKLRTSRGQDKPFTIEPFVRFLRCDAEKVTPVCMMCDKKGTLKFRNTDPFTLLRSKHIRLMPGVQYLLFFFFLAS